MQRDEFGRFLKGHGLYDEFRNKIITTRGDKHFYPTNGFKKGHIPKIKGKSWNELYGEEKANKMRAKLKAKKAEYWTTEARQKIGNSIRLEYAEGRRKVWNEGTKGVMKGYWIGKKRDKATIDKWSSTFREKFKKGLIEPTSHWRGKSLSQTHKENITEGMRKSNKFMESIKHRPRQSPNHKSKIREIMLKKWSDKIFRETTIEKTLKALFKRPTSYETTLNEVLEKYQPNQWKYVGDGAFLIGYKNPDFINTNGHKICIEVFHPFFKIRNYGSIQKYVTKRREHFLKYGWRTLFFNKNNLNHPISVIKKIERILGQADSTISPVLSEKVIVNESEVTAEELKGSGKMVKVQGDFFIEDDELAEEEDDREIEKEVGSLSDG